MPWISTLHPWARSGALRMADDPMPSKETPLEKALGMMELPASVTRLLPDCEQGMGSEMRRFPGWLLPQP